MTLNLLRKRGFAPPVVIGLALLLTGSAAANSQVYRSALASTGWISVDQGKTSSLGTCWVVDRQRRWVVTNLHITEGFSRAKVYFPRYREGKVITQRPEYLKRTGVPGRVLAVSAKRDLALVQLEYLPPGVRALPLATQGPAPGSAAYYIGNPGNVLWSFRSGRVIQRHPNFEVNTSRGRGKTRALETSARTESGFSGGPVVNARGQLVGVHCSVGEVTGTAFGVEVSEVRAFLHEARNLLARNATRPAARR